MSLRKLSFSNSVDVTEPGVVHKFCFNLSRPYIKKKSILNIGCWVGNYEYFLNEFSCYGVAIDIEKKALDVAKKNCKNISFVQSSALDLPFKDGTFDVVTMWLVLEHLANGTESSVLSELNRVSKKGGILIFSTPAGSALSKFLDPAYFLTGHRHYSKNKLEKFLVKNEFCIKNVTYKGGFFSAISAIVFYFFKHVLKRKMPKIKILGKLIEKEYKGKGFADIYLVAKKKNNI